MRRRVRNTRRIRNMMVARRHDERGSIILAVLIIAIICTVGSVMADRVVGDQRIVGNRQSTASAVSLADGGLADALFRLDQGTAGTGTGTYFCVKPSDNKCVAAAVPGAPGVSYVARQTSSTEWTIQSIATTGGQTAAVQEDVTHTSMYPFAMFGESALTINGNAGQSFSTYDSSRTYSTSSTTPNPDPNGQVAIGSNGAINCGASLGANVTLEYYGAGGVGSTQDSGCGSASYQSHSNTYYLPAPSAPTGAMACPGAGVMGSGVTGAPSVLATGTYLCTTPITISGLLTVTGPVELYVMLDPSLYNSSTSAITIVPGSFVNDQYDYCTSGGGTSGCSPTPDLPNSENLELLTNATGTVGNANGGGYFFAGVMYAPSASLTLNGCKSSYYGSLVVNTLTCDGGPHLWVSYDEVLTSDYGPWATSGYTEINQSTVSIP